MRTIPACAISAAIMVTVLQAPARAPSMVLLLLLLPRLESRDAQLQAYPMAIRVSAASLATTVTARVVLARLVKAFKVQ